MAQHWIAVIPKNNRCECKMILIYKGIAIIDYLIGLR